MKNLRLPLAEEPPRGPRSTGIEWTDTTWNPVAGCRKVSPGCAHCYAEPITYRLSQNPMTPQYHGLAVLDAHGRPRFTGDARLAAKRLEEPLHWRDGRMVFVNSMSDLFHEDITNEDIAAVMGVIAATPRHTYQVLTKRAERLPIFADWICNGDSWPVGKGPGRGASKAMWHAAYALPGGKLDVTNGATAWPLPNLWLGMSVEDRKHGLPRIEHLRRTPAAERFLSIEPLLEDLGDILAILMGLREVCGTCRRGESRSCLDDPTNRVGPPIDWVIVGGESGPGARPMHPDWVRSIRDQCVAAGVPFFFKQWGGWVAEAQAPNEITLPSTSNTFVGHGGMQYFQVGKKAAGHLLDGVEWRQMPRRS